MRIFDVIAAGVAIGLTGKILTSLQDNSKRQKEEIDRLEDKIEKEKQRRSTPCQFNKTLSQKEFEQIVTQTVKKIKRDITIQIEYATIYATVTSQSGISTWRFEIDFNDWGQLTGKYYLRSENEDSIIPENLAKSISQQIKDKMLWFT